MFVLIFGVVFSSSWTKSATDFDPDGVFGGPLLVPPSTSARVQSRVEFVELGRGVCSTCQGEVPGVTGITG